MRGPVHKNTHRAAVAILAACTWSGASAGELADLLRSALDHPAIQARAEETQSAQSEFSASTKRYFGRGELIAEVAHYNDERFTGAFTPAAFANPYFAQNASRYAVIYNVPIDLFGAIAASRAAARSNLEAAQLLEKQESLMRLHAVTSAFLSLQSLQAQEDALNAQRTRVTTTLERIRREVQVQLSSGVDLKLAESELARLESDEVRLNGMKMETSAALIEAAGREPTSTRTLQKIPSWPQKSEDVLAVQLAKAQADALTAQAREAHRSLLPQLSAVGDYSIFEGAEGIPDAWSVGARFTVPLELAAYRRASALDAKARAAARRQTAAVGEYDREWARLRASYQSAIADMAAAQKETEARAEVVRVQTELQRVGMTSIEDLLRQQRDLFDSQSRFAVARAQAIMTWSASQVVLGTNAADYIEAIDPSAR